MKYFIFCYLVLQFSFSLEAATLHVGAGFPYTTLQLAIQDVMPGDTIIVHEGTYPGGIYIENLQGATLQWISLFAADGETVIFEGGTNAWQFTDAAYLHIRGFIFQHQTGNGVNFDDGGTYDSPAHHIVFEDCIFRDMTASGNNDLLKLSGVDSFEIRKCMFINGASGGSGIDMVGCHSGLISQCHFENLGSNSVQAKGGTSNIRIERNFFKNGGFRALNLGGSTGLQFFRPIDAAYEATELKVYSNIFIGSEAPIAFVGSINCEVINNTIYLPDKWVMRILQETVDETRFPPCGYNTFRNNIIYINNDVTVEVNIGPNTAPGTFTFSHNLWFHSQDNSWSGPVLPVEDVMNIVGQDPLFQNSGEEDFSIIAGSPAIGAALDVPQPEQDFAGNQFSIPRSIGALEGDVMTGTIKSDSPTIAIYPNPFTDEIFVEINDYPQKFINAWLYDIHGRAYSVFPASDQPHHRIIRIGAETLPPGYYWMTVSFENMPTVNLPCIKVAY